MRKLIGITVVQSRLNYKKVPPQKRYATFPKRAHATENILPASVKDSLSSLVHCPNNFPDVPGAVGATDMDGTEDLPLIDDDFSTDIARQVSQESLALVSQIRTHVEPKIDKTSNLGSMGGVY